MGKAFQNREIAGAAISDDQFGGINSQKSGRVKLMKGREHLNGTKMEEVRS